MAITRETYEHSDLLGSRTWLYLVWILTVKKKVSFRKMLLCNRVSIKRYDFFELLFLRF